MAKIENKALHILQEEANGISAMIKVSLENALRAETNYNKFIHEKAQYEADLKHIQDAITILTASKKKAKKDD